ncbi:MULTISPECIES: hypothetical protein [unclassified Lentimonas]|uniref:hypothetical protein n=1 Tax=unclassified Lentimonas TaxID=2630993 RepID=UPI0013251FFD|nr:MULTISPECIES: hypothetical protein [unclassified Lentimonas]CAA6678508.1 Unannotated [Lentimonas sp. CC4]CAA6685740.1 Unannotated [Lentimonas sp. CC6]CAA7076214.1 Unannotated [Lentimonas sp. CC4]CAA7168734.1 Unannotated [Lentimonas sp. CC21]CAA7183472.1 Unannotated [Lentimonas sp. CC8]
MRIFYISLLALLPFMGFSLNAAVCVCPQSESAQAGIDAVPCCQESPATCCMQQNREPAPEQPLLSVVHKVDTFQLTLVALATLSDDRAILRPQAGLHAQRARPPPLPVSAQRCTLQSWLI